MPITVVHPVWRLENGGLERQLLRLISRKDSELRHVLIIRGQSSEAVSHLPPGVRILSEPDTPDPNWSRRLAWILRNEQADIIHLRGLSMLLDGVLAAELTESARVLFSFHGFESASRRWSTLRRTMLRESILRCDDRAAVSATAARQLADELSLPHDLFSIIPNGVDAEYFKEAAGSRSVRQSLGLPLDRLIILCVANIKPIKGHSTLIRAIARLSGLDASTTYVMVGHDYSAGASQAEAQARCPRADIRFVGRQEDIAPWYQAADLYVQPSLWEGDCNSLLEAMSSALPIIATDVGGNRDALDNERTGILVPPDEPTALAAAIQALATDTPRRNCLGRAARQQVLASRSIAMTLGRWADRYKNLAARTINPSRRGICRAADRPRSNS